MLVKAANPCWLHPTSILDVSKVFEHLHILWMGILVLHYTVTSVQGGSQILENGILVDPEWCCGVMLVEAAVKPHWLHPTFILDVYKVFEHLHMLWMKILVLHYTVISVQGGSQILENGILVDPEWRCGVMLAEAAVKPHWLHPTFILDVYKVFELLHMLWMGIYRGTLTQLTVIPV